MPVELEKKKRRRELIVALLAAIVVGIIFYVESEVTRSSDAISYGGHLLLFGLLTVVTLLLILIVFFLIRNLFKLVFERRRKVLGSRLKTRLTLAFVALTLVPTVVLFIASAGVLHTTIESWFKAQVEDSMQYAMDVAEVFYQNVSEKTLSTGTRLSSLMHSGSLPASPSRDDLQRALKSWRKAEGVSSIRLYYRDGSVPIMVEDPALKGAPIPPPRPSFLKIGFHGKKTAKIIPMKDGSELISGIVPVKSTNSETVTAALVVDYYIPMRLASRLFSIYRAYDDYQQAKRMKGPIKTIYVLILLLVALLVIFIGFWFGVSMARDITDPILGLAEGTGKIAAGNLDVYIEPAADDELGVLVRSFNKMTSDLRKARDDLVRVNIDLENRRNYMETVLKNLAAGVLSLDSQGTITTMNDSAKNLLGITESAPLGKLFLDVLPEVSANAVGEIVEDLHNSVESVERPITIPFPDKSLSLLCFGNGLRDDDGRDLGLVLVFEDMTYLVKAQRMAAWREVARRIAHEIKNPLTPIQLNAQRLRRKYMDVLGEDSSILDKCTGTIIDQVEQLKTMVNEFSKFARMPTANPTPSNLNSVIRDVVDLFVQGNDQVEFKFDPDDTVPIVDLDKEQIKRAVVNLLDNAMAATSQDGRITVKTKYDTILSIASIEISDNGGGVDPQDMDRLFEPYFSRKPGGTGLGLTIVNTIVTDHNGFIRVKENPGGGTRFIVELPVRK
jgi:two-component system, NtrC family, nitrogen regulation sensor histidine kinase NtrY